MVVEAQKRNMLGEAAGTGMMVGLVGCNLAPTVSPVAPLTSKLIVFVEGGTITTNRVLVGMVKATGVVVRLTISRLPGALPLMYVKLNVLDPSGRPVTVPLIVMLDDAIVFS